MLLYSESLELRGVERKVSEKSGKPYLVVYLEETSGNPVRFVCRDVEVIKPDVHKKGGVYTGVFEYNRFGNLNLLGLEVEAK